LNSLLTEHYGAQRRRGMTCATPVRRRGKTIHSRKGSGDHRCCRSAVQQIQRAFLKVRLHLQILQVHCPGAPPNGTDSDLLDVPLQDLGYLGESIISGRSKIPSPALPVVASYELPVAL
jgi:hypothetical protein